MPEHVKEHSWIQDGFLYTPITSIETRPFTGRVHNFEVAEQHSYVTDSFTIHNCGDLMYIYIKVKDDILTDVKFKTFGCGAAIATSSMVTDLAKGKTIQEALKITRKDVADNLGGLPPQKMHCSNLAADALHEAIHDYLRKQGREPPLPPGAKKPHEEDHCETDPDSPIHIEDSVPKK
ncbi:MAG: iron-sulfur cluster assembly scaffold protein [Methanomassiliicoccus sp.]|nr:iron-sulfur cluster assembly scaffold protein [Methanomassiliicoccus sp.]